jgi:hypothetical protein
MSKLAARLFTVGLLGVLACQTQEPQGQEPAPAAQLASSGEPTATAVVSDSPAAVESAVPSASAVASAAASGIKAPSSANVDPHLARQEALRQAAEMGMIGLLDSKGASADLFGRDGVSARGNMWGDEIGEAYGVGGLGLRGSGAGLGGTGRAEGIGLGNVGTLGRGAGAGGGAIGFGSGRLSGGPKASSPSVRMGATTVSGGLAPEVVQRVVRRQFSRIRYCYEKGLTNNPTLAGKITTSFTISATGATEGIATNSDLNDKEVVSCVSQTFASLSFPKPESGVVKVTFPISFSPGEKPATETTGKTAAEPTIAGKVLAEVTALEIEKALRDNGFTDLSSTIPAGTNAVVITAKKGTRTFTLTFVSAKAGTDALSPEERKRLTNVAKVFSASGLFLAVESDDPAESQKVLDTLIKRPS